MKYEKDNTADNPPKLFIRLTSFNFSALDFNLKRNFLMALLIIGMLLPAACTTTRPNHIESVCKIFKQYPKWYWATQDAERKWGVPINVQMAIMYQESHFNAKAKPPRRWVLWVIPWTRPSSAYGYSQALNGTWKRYRQEVGRRWASRDAFHNAADFIGWYGNKIVRETRISPRNARAMYLAYHDGIGGYKRGTYRKKPWLMRVANNVQRRANVYRTQLQGCQSKLPKKPLWRRLLMR